MIHVKRFLVGLLVLAACVAVWLASEWSSTWPDAVWQTIATITVGLMIVCMTYFVGYFALGHDR